MSNLSGDPNKWRFTIHDIRERDDEIARLRAEVATLRAAMHDIYEVYAGSEGFIPETCAEGYLQERVKEMADIAAKHKSAAAEALKETDNE